MTYSPEERSRYMNAYRAKRRQEAIEFLGGECTKCGSRDRLEFDHIDPQTKSGSIASMLTVARDQFWREVGKCQLLCRECHVEKSRAEGSWPGGQPPHPVKHSVDEVERMAEMRAEGMSLRAIAAEFDTTHRTVASRLNQRG